MVEFHRSTYLGVGAFSRVKGAMPRLVAMFPRLEEQDDEEEGSAPAVCGMDLITIPYASEVRDIAALKMGTTDGKEIGTSVVKFEWMSNEIVNDDITVSQEEVEAAEALVTALQFEDGFQYQSLENPMVQHVYGVLQAIALNQEESDWKADRDDKLQPDAEGIAANAAVFQNFQLVTGAEHSDVAGSSSSASRGKKRAADGGDSSAKKAKTGGLSFLLPDGAANMDSLKAPNAEDLLIKETAANLKVICKALNVSATGTKPVLVTKILGAVK
jgi:hypothetical protein